jgi:hypothetical protein
MCNVGPCGKVSGSLALCVRITIVVGHQFCTPHDLGAVHPALHWCQVGWRCPLLGDLFGCGGLPSSAQTEGRVMVVALEYFCVGRSFPVPPLRRRRLNNSSSPPHTASWPRAKL